MIKSLIYMGLIGLFNTSGGRVVASSNLVTPTESKRLKTN